MFDHTASAQTHTAQNRKLSCGREADHAIARADDAFLLQPAARSQHEIVTAYLIRALLVLLIALLLLGIGGLAQPAQAQPAPGAGAGFDPSNPHQGLHQQWEHSEQLMQQLQQLEAEAQRFEEQATQALEQAAAAEAAADSLDQDQPAEPLPCTDCSDPDHTAPQVFAPALTARSADGLTASPASRDPFLVPFGREAELRQAVRTFQSTGKAPTILRSDALLYPFGESDPVVRCAPLRACDIQLQAGEVITGVALGDSERWLASPLLSGDPGRPTPHVLVKPTDFGLETNMVVGTTQRTYHLRLISPKAAKADDEPYHRRVAFYYPEAMVQTWASEQQLARAQADTVVSENGFSVDDLNFGYRIPKGSRLPFSPRSVFDDGRHLYIQLPPSKRPGDLPALLVGNRRGQLGVANYRVRGRWIIVDGLYPRAELVIGVGRQRKTVRIVRIKG